MTVLLLLLLLLLLTFNLLLGTSAQRPLPHLPPSGCSTELVAFSPCLSYVSVAPNNLTETVTSQCCDAVSSAFESGDGDCLCYLLRQPLIFGFPLNETRVVSLSSICNTNGSLESICSSESPALPPLRSTTGSEISKPSDAGTFNASPPSMSMPPQSDRNSPPPLSSPAANGVKSPTGPSSPMQPASGSSYTPRFFNSSAWLVPGILQFLLAYIDM